MNPVIGDNVVQQGPRRTAMRQALAFACALGLLGIALSAAAQQSGDFTYSSDGTSITITRYLGNGGFVTIPGTIDGLPVTSIGGAAFRDCTSLTSILIPGALTSSVTGLFDGCTNLVTIQVSASNPVYSSFEGVLFNKDQTVLAAYPPGIGGPYSIPDTVASVEFGAFWNCSRLTSVLMPDRLNEIGPYGFFGCTALTDAVIPTYVTQIGDSAFSGCTSLTEVVIPNGVASIGYATFEMCAGLTNLVIAPSVTSIGAFAFFGCADLASVTIPHRVKDIQDFAFAGCSLTNLTIGRSVRTIGEAAFGGCTGLGAITIPASVTYLGFEAFSGCTGLTAAFFEGNAPSVGSTFYGADMATIYYLPGTVGWGPTFDGLPTAPWVLPYPVILSTPPNFGIQTNRFGFIISWATNASVVVEASESLNNPAWAPVSTNDLSDGWSHFVDPESGTYQTRFYRLLSL